MLARFSDSTGWSAFNPSLTSTPEHGYIVLIRSANNYMQDHRVERRTEYGDEINNADSLEDPNEWEGWGTYSSLWNGKPQYHNKMFLAKLDVKKLMIGSLQEVDTSASESAAPAPITRGLEDGRIYHDGESLRISCTAFEPNQPPHAARIANVRLNLPSLSKPSVSEFNLFPTPGDPERPEKNWMPVEKGLIPEDERPSWDYIYSTGKTFTIKGNKFTDVGGFDIPQLRGGSQLVRMPDGTYLAIMHQVVTNDFMRFSSVTKSPLARRRYVHRFAQFDEKGRLLKVTDKFTFTNKSIEFAAGLAFHQDRLLVTLGVMDCYSYVSSLSFSDVQAALRPPRV
jgi:hypothetical protein